MGGVFCLGQCPAIDGFARRPAGFVDRVAAVYADLGTGAHAAALARLEALVSETAAL